ncbi:hypothetical protein J7E88_09290 [Streptomyces sp. ISL-10]|uniref:hypothetical protein n=1 Tax=Streptomyces sp. ISL-10 TaxID=2819172 RepID=UPI001BEA0932|nr:hypothetical protein [Streptomyces sp. ISL-10]MBT2365509.1 hypothetical protein [Streptomyces sp. ISL-10]
MKKRSILAVMSLATGAVIAAVSPPPAAQADALGGTVSAPDALSSTNALTAETHSEVQAAADDAAGRL